MMNDADNGLMVLLPEEPMISMRDQRRAAIRQAFAALPAEMRAEIVDGDIVVSPAIPDQSCPSSGWWWR